MIGWLQVIVVGLSLLLGVVVVVYVARDRAADVWLVGGFGVLEALLLVQAGVGCIQLATTGRDVDGLVFVGYLLGSLLVPPAALVWSLAERSRSGSAVLLVGALTVPVLVSRLQAVWTAGPGVL
jgi:hypothetical protein